MLVTTTPNEIRTNVQLNPIPFTVELNAITFEILSKELYQNPIKAIIRELSCNAIDSHIRAGTADTPFDIHLPTNFEPTFSIRDYGTGLSQEGIECLYTGYFKSDKRHTNDEIGGKGLGSKTPLAYADSFIVISYHKGTKWTYNVYKNEFGVPTLTQITHQSTDEPNGLEIIIAVKNEDTNKFVCEAKTILPWMHYRITNEVLYHSIPKIERLYVTSEFELIDSPNSKPMVLMGNIMYPIDTYRVLNNYTKHWATKNLGLVIKAPIGTLDVTASRDDLHYTDRTLKWLTDKLEKAILWTQKTLEDEIQNYKNLTEATIHLHGIAKKIYGPNDTDCSRLGIKYYDQNGSHSLNLDNININIDCLQINRPRRVWMIKSNNSLRLNESLSYYLTKHNPTKKRISETDYPFSCGYIIPTEKLTSEIRDYFTLLEIELTDISHLFEPKPKEKKKKIQRQKVIWHKSLENTGIYEHNAPPPEGAYYVRRNGTDFPNFPTFTSNHSDNNLKTYLNSWLPNAYIVVISNTTPKYGQPKDGINVADVIKTELINYYKKLTQEDVDKIRALNTLNEQYNWPPRTPRDRNLTRDLYLLHKWAFTKLTHPDLYKQTNIIHNILREHIK